MKPEHRCLNLKIGYWQVKIHSDDIETIALPTGSGLDQFKVMPFDHLRNGIAGTTLEVLPYAYYLDYAIIFSRSLKDHLRHLQRILGKPSNVGPDT